MRLIWMLPLFVSACDLAEDHFDDEVADRWCARQKACDEDAFFQQWLLGTPDCREAIAVQVNDHRYGNGQEACRYDSDLARACVSQVDGATCDELLSSNFVDHCAQDVWDCISIVNPGAP